MGTLSQVLNTESQEKPVKRRVRLRRRQPVKSSKQSETSDGSTSLSHDDKKSASSSGNGSKSSDIDKSLRRSRSQSVVDKCQNSFPLADEDGSSWKRHDNHSRVDPGRTRSNSQFFERPKKNDQGREISPPII